MARLRLCAVVLAALLLGAAHAERIEDASEEDDAGLGYIVTLNDDDADAEDLCAALAADTDDFNTGGAAHPLDFTAEFPLLRRYEQVACARRVQGICRRVFRRGALGINGMVVDALSRGRIRALARCLPNAVVEPDLPVTAQALDSGNPTVPLGTSTGWTRRSSHSTESRGCTPPRTAAATECTRTSSTAAFAPPTASSRSSRQTRTI